jgi:asparagine synthase (glutamine-hydrolysing)
VWIRGWARDLIHDMLSPESIRRRMLFDSKYVTRLVEEHDSGRFDHSDQLWGLLSVEMWCRSFVDHASPAAAASDRCVLA